MLLQTTAVQSDSPAVSFSIVGAKSPGPVTPDDSDSLADIMQLMGSSISYLRNSEVFGEGEPADYLFKILAGSVRTYKVLSDGRRQIGGFYLAGDIIGLQFGETYSLSAEAIGDSRILVLKRSALNALADGNWGIAREIATLTARELRAMQQRIFLLVQSAQERVASFLLEMADRRPSDDTIELPMTRQDIADYLGLTIETVSRTLTALENVAAIERPTMRRVVLRNRPALKRLNG